MPGVTEWTKCVDSSPPSLADEDGHFKYSATPLMSPGSNSTLSPSWPTNAVNPGDSFSS